MSAFVNSWRGGGAVGRRCWFQVGSETNDCSPYLLSLLQHQQQQKLYSSEMYVSCGSIADAHTEAPCRPAAELRKLQEARYCRMHVIMQTGGGQVCISLAQRNMHATVDLGLPRCVRLVDGNNHVQTVPLLPMSLPLTLQTHLCFLTKRKPITVWC